MVDTKQIKKVFWKYFNTSGPDREVNIGSDGKVNVHGDVQLMDTDVKQLPVSFGTVSGNFRCIFSSLTSLVGAPHHVKGYFICSNSELTSLEGAPQHVGGDFICHHNKLTSLMGAPKHVGDTFDCEYNPLTSLGGAPEHVGDEFWCTWNPQLPVLRLITYPHPWIGHAPDSVTDIIRKYAGTKNPADILKCASDLNEAGFEGNAEW